MERVPKVGIVGAGPVGTALGVAIGRAGWPVVAVASRDADRRARFAAAVPGVRSFAESAAVLPKVDLVVLAVPDDAIAAVVTGLRLRRGQMLIHTSGVLAAEVLEPAAVDGGHVGAFHPLVSFTSDVERSVAGLAGCTIAIEGDDTIVPVLERLRRFELRLCRVYPRRSGDSLEIESRNDLNHLFPRILIRKPCRLLIQPRRAHSLNRTPIEECM